MAILVIKIKRCEAQCKRKSRLYLVSAGEPRSLGKENAKEIRVPKILFNTFFSFILIINSIVGVKMK